MGKITMHNEISHAMYYFSTYIVYRNKIRALIKKFKHVKDETHVEIPRK